MVYYRVMKKLIPLLFLFALFIAIIGLSTALFPPAPAEEPAIDDVRYEQSVISLANVSLAVEIPLTKSGFEKGLGEREFLKEDSGMLFLCVPETYQKFWMKGMRFPIDIIWIDESFTVADITPNIIPESFPETFMPSERAPHVLEVNGGFAEEHGIPIGTMVYGLGGAPCRRSSF